MVKRRTLGKRACLPSWIRLVGAIVLLGGSFEPSSIAGSAADSTLTAS
jgi:hypothetical protein